MDWAIRSCRDTAVKSGTSVLSGFLAPRECEEENRARPQTEHGKRKPKAEPRFLPNVTNKFKICICYLRNNKNITKALVKKPPVNVL